MADYLVYWKSYWSDVTAQSQITQDWSTKSATLYQRVSRGDRIWVVVSAGKVAPAEWRLLHSLLVERRSIKATKWGRYHMVGDPARSALYKLDPQPDLAAVLRLLSFAGGRRLTVKGRLISKALQTRGFRVLSEKDGDLLAAYGATLPRFSSK